MTDLSDRPGRHLTTRQGHPVADNANSRTIGPRGPATLENYHLLEKLSHFDRERVPERVVHARGFTAHGVFEAYGAIGHHPASRFTRAHLFAEAGRLTPVTVRFSTVIGGRDSSECARDPRGFAVKFRTEQGNWDLVGNNLKVFFIRDAIKFPDVIHALKPDPVTHRQEPARIFDFMSLTPESMHMLSFLFGPKGIPRDYRHMNGAGVNTYKLVNASGEAVLVKFHWISQQGDVGMTEAEAAQIQAGELGHASKDLYDAIERGDYPRWELAVQVMSDDEHPELDFDPLDDTKTWPESDFPLMPVGMMMLDRNVDDFHNESEQVAFGTGVLVDGIDFSDDKMLIGRTFSYSDTQRYRVGPNYLQLPVNQPVVPVATNQRGGAMSYGVDLAEDPHVNYEPSMGGLGEADRAGYPHEPHYDARKVSAVIARENNYGQVGVRWREDMAPEERDDLVLNLVTALRQCPRPIQARMTGHALRCDEEYGRRLADGLSIDLGEADRAVAEVEQFLAKKGRPNACAH